MEALHLVDRELVDLYNSEPKSVKYKLFSTVVDLAQSRRLRALEFGERFHILITNEFFLRWGYGRG